MTVRQIRSDMPFDDRRREIVFTRYAVEADPLTTGLLQMTESWLTDNEQARAATLAADDAEMRSDAHRTIANAYIDLYARRFGFELEYGLRRVDPDIKQPKQTTEFRQYFKVSPSVFVRLPFREELAQVGAWLSMGAHAALDVVRPKLAFWHARATDALKTTDESALVRGTAQVVREQHAEDLTRSRDALWRALSEIAAENNLPRDWADSFFRRGRSDADAEPEPVESAEPVAA